MGNAAVNNVFFGRFLITAIREPHVFRLLDDVPPPAMQLSLDEVADVRGLDWRWRADALGVGGGVVLLLVVLVVVLLLVVVVLLLQIVHVKGDL